MMANDLKQDRPAGFLLRAVLIVACLFAVGGLAAHQSWRNYHQQAQITVDNLARSLGMHITSVIGKTDHALQTIAMEAERQLARGRTDAGLLERRLAEQRSLLPDLTSLRIVDAQGAFRYGAGMPAEPGVSIADRDDFIRLRDSAQAGLVVSGPHLGRIRNDRWLMVFARRLNHPDGTFAGMVLATVSTDRFAGMLGTLRLGPNGMVAMRTADASLVAHIPMDSGRGPVGSKSASPEFVRSIGIDPESGTFVAQSPVDHVERVLAYRRLGTLPLYVIVGLAKQDFLSPWRHEVANLAGFVIFFSAVSVWFLWAAHRSARRQAAALEKLRAANDQLEGFVFASSHDLRGPLMRISNFSTLLEKRYRDRLDGEGLTFLQFIRDNTARLIRLMDGLLAHAHVAHESPRLQPVDVQEAVLAVLRDSGEKVSDGSVDIRLDLQAARILADPLRLAQALGNLLENALKYSAGAAAPAVTIGGRAGEGTYRLWVKDNGIGFDMAYHDRIFEIFQRLHSGAEFPGTGIGLALVKRAMEKMGGKVWAESAPGQGATFFLELRAAAGPAPATASPFPGLRGDARLRPHGPAG